MAWAEIHQSLRDHKKTYALADDLGILPVYAVGHLTFLWLWALDNAPDGQLPNNHFIIARACCYAKQPLKLVNALIASGYVDRAEDDSLWLHDWEEYTGRLIEFRERKKENMRELRAKWKEQRGRNVADTLPPQTDHVAHTFPTSRAAYTQPNQTVPNQTAAAAAASEQTVPAARNGTDAAAAAAYLQTCLAMGYTAEEIHAAEETLRARTRQPKISNLAAYLVPLMEERRREAAPNAPNPHPPPTPSPDLRRRQQEMIRRRCDYVSQCLERGETPDHDTLEREFTVPLR